DVAHNIAKLETHEIDGEKRRVWVHRKGATRAFAPGSEGIPEKYKDVGQPVLIPGSMGTSSYVLVGTDDAMKNTFGSSAHGAGRTMSRVRAKKDYPAEKVRKDLAQKSILVKAASLKGISEEAPEAYKDVSEVVRVTEKAGIARIIAKLVPVAVVKG
ncbi:RNA-splicing ligase RtcB, partial [Candidatus Woesearchaeota archaeon]